MYLCGLQKLAMVDYPGKLAATVFTGGCNLRCPFCHNALLVTRLDETPELGEEAVLSFLATRTKLLDGVVLSGGEPLLQPDAADFLRKIRQMGFAVKLDTNGFFPDRLSAILEEGLVDYVAMDAPVAESVKLLRQSGVDFEFRTTLVREFHTPEDLLAIGRWLEGSPRYFLQAFVDSGNLVGSGCSPFTPQEMRDFTLLLQPFFGEVNLRGID